MVTIDWQGIITDIASFIKNFVWPALIAFVNFLLGLGPVMLKRLFIVIIITAVLYKLLRKMLQSTFFAFFASLIIAILGIRIIPQQFIELVLTPWILLFIFSPFFLIFLWSSKMNWKIRKTAIILLFLLLIGIWFFYGKDIFYLIGAAIFFIAFLLDPAINKLIFKVSAKTMKKSEIKGKIAVLNEERQALGKQEGNEQDFENISHQIEELQRRLEKMDKL